jgi:hypothetical protein
MIHSMTAHGRCLLSSLRFLRGFFLSVRLFLSAYLLLQVVYCTSHGNRVLVASARL